MNIDSGWLFAAIACAVGLAGFFGGRMSASRNDGERWGKLEATLGHIQDNLRDIRLNEEKNANNTRESLRRVHDRIDRHLRETHGITPQWREDE